MNKVELDLVIPTVGITLHANNQIQFFSSTTTIKISLNVPFDQIVYKTEDDPKKPWQLVKQDNEKDQNNLSPDIKNFPTSEIIESDLVRNARSLLERGNLDLCPTGVGGTYFVRDETNKTVAIFKPSDEEPGANNDPKRIVESPILPPGGGAKREVAAYLLGHALAKVPETSLIKTAISDPKKGSCLTKSGSIQKFVTNDGDATTFGSSNFRTEDVHNIGILDVRFLNKDRNGENILVQKQENNLHLVPIDHAYILPNNPDDIWFEWMTWRQAKQPFSVEALKYIASIDVENDTRILKSLGIEEDAIKLMRLSTLLLQTGAQSGLTLYDMASLICRKKPTEKSDFESMVHSTKDKSEEEVKQVVEELVTSKLSRK